MMCSVNDFLHQGHNWTIRREKTTSRWTHNSSNCGSSHVCPCGPSGYKYCRMHDLKKHRCENERNWTWWQNLRHNHFLCLSSFIFAPLCAKCFAQHLLTSFQNKTSLLFCFKIMFRSRCHFSIILLHLAVIFLQGVGFFQCLFAAYSKCHQSDVAEEHAPHRPVEEVIPASRLFPVEIDDGFM